MTWSLKVVLTVNQRWFVVNRKNEVLGEESSYEPGIYWETVGLALSAPSPVTTLQSFWV